MTARARTAMNLVLFAVLVVLCVPIAAPAMRASKRREQVAAVAPEARALYEAFRTYRDRNGVFPDVHGTPPFDAATFEPLRRRGYYHGSIGNFLLGGRIDAYDAPDDKGTDHEFWMEMTLAADPGVRILIASSNSAPLGRGKWTDGVFVVCDGTMVRL